jgi:transcriptional regulator with XRE-family HTH domain
MQADQIELADLNNVLYNGKHGAELPMRTAPASDPTRAPTSALELLRVNLIVERARARLSQTELAERAGVARPTISRIERAVGDVGIEVVQRIATALGITVASLFEPVDMEPADDDEIARRAAAPRSEYGDVRDLLAALDESAAAAISSEPRERYSKAGRRRTVAR